MNGITKPFIYTWNVNILWAVIGALDSDYGMPLNFVCIITLFWPTNANIIQFNQLSTMIVLFNWFIYTFVLKMWVERSACKFFIWKCFSILFIRNNFFSFYLQLCGLAGKAMILETKFPIFTSVFFYLCCLPLV